jgi:hypothetical protein
MPTWKQLLIFLEFLEITSNVPDNAAWATCSLESTYYPHTHTRTHTHEEESRREEEIDHVHVQATKPDKQNKQHKTTFEVCQGEAEIWILKEGSIL